VYGKFLRGRDAQKTNSTIFFKEIRAFDPEKGVSTLSFYVP
jgi:hypothetical protein